MKKTLFTIAFFAIITTSNAQIAEELFKTKYSKIGLEVGSQILFTKNQTNAAQYKWLTSQSVFFGFNYNFYQRKNLNLKVAITYSLFDQSDDYLVLDGSGTALMKAGSEGGPYNLFSMPIDAEYFFRVKSNLLLSVNTGLEFTYNMYGSDEGISRTARGVNGFITDINSVEKAPDFPLYLGVNAGLSFSIASKPMLLKFNVKYHKNFNSYLYEATSKIEINGISVANENKSSLTGDYFGLGISINPNKNFFR